ncbi:hypothetical protein PIB30_098340 [Stylosanthes scabra]|uniref:Uncharacterized protein n=1 Tax=Stylosanthes scabra TaxID=79078 RepID=A0ABU6YVF0_9FABA|nr:hypothetical protein [Stylosanthes scabra]
MSIKSSFTLEMLKKNLHKKLGLMKNEVVGRMAYRIPYAVDVGKWQFVDVDDDIACIFDMHSVFGSFRTMYLYVESEIGENLPASATLADIGSTPLEEVEQAGGRARRRRTRLAATRIRLRDDEPSSSSSQSTQSSMPAPTVSPSHPLL